MKFKEKLSKFSRELLKSLEKELLLLKTKKRKISNEDQNIKIFNGRPHSAPCFFPQSKKIQHFSPKNREKANNSIESIKQKEIINLEKNTKTQGFYLSAILKNEQNTINDKKLEGICLFIVYPHFKITFKLFL